MFDDFQKILQAIRELPDPERVAAANTAFVTWCVANVVRYLVTGVVVWALGRRVLQAVFAAWREAKRTGST